MFTSGLKIKRGCLASMVGEYLVWPGRDMACRRDAPFGCTVFMAFTEWLDVSVSNLPWLLE